MPNVTNLEIKLQTGSSNNYYATWDFTETVKKTVTTSGGFKKGDWVTIKSGATYYNGVRIPSWVMSDTWKLTQVKGDRAVLGVNGSGNDICSPISTKYLNGGSGGSSSTVTETTNYLDHYEVKWYYATGDGIWFEGSSSTNVTEKNHIYSPPENASRLKVSVKPVSKTYTVNNTSVAYWTGSWQSQTHYTSVDPPEKPPNPTVELDKFKLTASINNVSDARTDQIQFEIYNLTKKVNSGVVKVEACMATYTYTVTAGGEYRVRCRAVNLNESDEVYSEWTDFSSSLGTIPTAPDEITELRALSTTSVYMDWTDVTTAETYDIEYTTKKSYFDTSSEVSSITIDAIAGHAEITGLETGQEYFFRVRAANDQGKSDWCPDIKSVVIGRDPAAPTTWSSTTTAITGEPLTLYWVHNSEDGSSQTYAELSITVDGVTDVYTITNTTDEDKKDQTSSYPIDTSVYSEGSHIEWQVRTAGVTKNYGEWSVLRTIDIYAPPTLELDMTDSAGDSISILTTFPFYISGVAGPNTQRPIGYYVVISSNEAYETVDNLGNAKLVNNGEEVFSRYFDTSDPLLFELSAGNIDLENYIHYTIACTASMNSGLTANASLDFSVDWVEVSYEPDAEIGIDDDTYAAYISPYCLDSEGAAIEDVRLSIYRREYDGRFTEIATGLDQTVNEYITDPHPALDFARYRIVAMSLSTGAVSYYDPPGYPVGCTSIIIQWDDEWTNFETSATDIAGPLESPLWAGSMLKLPYNVDVSDNNNIDVAFAEYIGRENPVSYYGTQVGSSASWNTEIPKEDKETLYGLRRLSIYRGDVYVREPSGSGYWANVKVSFSQKYNDLVVPVSLDLTRVEGGV